METKELIGLDVGTKRTGIARASSVARLAEPLKTVATDDLLQELNQLLKASPVEAVVVGLPRNLQGDDTAQTTWVRDWAMKTKAKLEAPFFYQDEALTTKSALAHNLATGKTIDKDSLAAAIILQDFLDTPEAERVLC